MSCALSLRDLSIEYRIWSYSRQSWWAASCVSLSLISSGPRDFVRVQPFTAHGACKSFRVDQTLAIVHIIKATSLPKYVKDLQVTQNLKFLASCSAPTDQTQLSWSTSIPLNWCWYCRARHIISFSPSLASPSSCICCCLVYGTQTVQIWRLSLSFLTPYCNIQPFSRPLWCNWLPLPFSWFLEFHRSGLSSRS